MTEQITRVLPMETKTEPLACGATFNSKLIGRISSGARPSFRCIGEKLDAGPNLCDEDLRSASDAGGLLTTHATTIGRNSARVSVVAVQNGNERISGGLRVSL